MKSNKKLFAILTLVAFMMTLLPMAAFAAGADYTQASSTVSPKSLSLDVYSADDDLGKITITFKDGTTPVATGSTVEFYIKSDRDAEFGRVEGNAGAIASFIGSQVGKGDGKGIAIPVKAGGKVEVYVGSKISGSFKLSFYTLPATDDDARLIETVTATVSVGDGKVVLFGKNEDNDDTATIGIYSDARAFNASAGDISIDKDAAGQPVVAAGEGIELEAVVEDGGIALEDKEVTFQYRYNNGSWFTLATEVTDDEGIATCYVEQTKTGTYEYRASIGSSSTDKSKIIKMKVAPDYDRTKNVYAIKTIELSTTDGAKVAQKAKNNVDFLIKDQYGNAVKEFIDNDFEVAFGSAPAGSKFEDKDWNQGGHLPHADVTQGVISDGKVRIEFTPDKLGSYNIKIRNANEKRVSANITVEAIDFEKAASLKFVLKNNVPETVTNLVRVYDTNVYGNEENKVAGQLKIYKVSADGAELEVTNGDGLTISSPDTGKVAVDNSQTADFGKITVKKDAIGTYPLTVYFSTDNIIATYDLVVVGSVSSLAVTPTVTGTSATVAIQYIDKNGNNTFTNDSEEAFSVSVPAGVSATNFKNINKKGAGSFELSAAQPGTYTVTVITSGKKIAKTFDITFGPNVGDKPAYGAKKVTMFIGATGYVSDGSALVTDVAPFIVDGRTFVAVRPVADAFGAEIGWNEATQTVTLTRADVTITIVIGSNTLTVVKGGVTSTITADVAAFIKDGRTVLPFRAVGEAFGATVSYDAATQAVTYEQ